MTLFEQMGGSEGCLKLANAFYDRVGPDQVLKPLFPGKTLNCAKKEFAAFLIQLLDGPESDSQFRWWLSLQASHARFKISKQQRDAWLSHMDAALAETQPDHASILYQFFETIAPQVTGYSEPETIEIEPELDQKWKRQIALEDFSRLLREEEFARATEIADQFIDAPSKWVGLAAELMSRESEALHLAVAKTLETFPQLLVARFNGRTPLHYAAAAGRSDFCKLMIALGADVHAQDLNGHQPLHRCANECPDPLAPETISVLIKGGADINSAMGSTRLTPLHFAARRGHLEATRALLSLGANTSLRDRRGDTPLDRARNCRQPAIVTLLESAEADS